MAKVLEVLMVTGVRELIRWRWRRIWVFAGWMRAVRAAIPEGRRRGRLWYWSAERWLGDFAAGDFEGV